MNAALQVQGVAAEMALGVCLHPQFKSRLAPEERWQFTSKATVVLPNISVPIFSFSFIYFVCMTTMS